MAVKIRLARRGRKKLALYDVVVADARSPRDGRFIEKIGSYNPLSHPATVVLEDSRALHWLLQGAQPTPTAQTILSQRGVLLKKHLQVGVLKKAITQEQADERYAAWLTEKEAKLKNKADKLSLSKAATAKSRLEAETKAREAKSEAVRKKTEAALNAVQASEVPATDTNAEPSAPETEVPATQA